MKYIGKNKAYCEVVDIGLHDKHRVEVSQPSELMLIWFTSDNNIFKVDNVDYVFNTNDIVCFTEFHKIEIERLYNAELIKWNKFFYCIINHDSQVGCKGILFYGAVTLPVIYPSDEEMESIQVSWNMLKHEMFSNDNLQEEMLQTSLKSLLVLCTRIYRSQASFRNIEDNNVDILREYHFLVEKHFREKHSVHEYAELLFKSPKTLSNIFKKIGSKTPLQYIQDRRILEAKRLLQYSDCSISEVGYELGFGDLQSFSRFFKRETGISPKNYQSNLRTGKIDKPSGKED